MNSAFVTNLGGYTAKTRLAQSTLASALVKKRCAAGQMRRVAARTLASVATKPTGGTVLNSRARLSWSFVPTAPLLAALSGLPPLASAGEEGAMTVQFGAYLAVFLGTLIPVAFLIILYIQSETRKAAMEAVSGGSEEEEELEFE